MSTLETHTLRVWRQLREWSVDELAKRAGMHPVTVRRHEVGYKQMSRGSLAIYADALGIKVEQIEKPKRKG